MLAKHQKGAKPHVLEAKAPGGIAGRLGGAIHVDDVGQVLASVGSFAVGSLPKGSPTTLMRHRGLVIGAFWKEYGQRE